MYWFREGQAYTWLFIIPFALLILLGGWLIASHAYRLKSRERLITGGAIGLVLYVFFANMFGHVLPPSVAFWSSAVFVFISGILIWRGSNQKIIDIRDLRWWKTLLALGVIAVLIALMARGLSIFDDRKNVSIISLMAAGDIPPHFYMNSELSFAYHYGFQLVGASLMRLGGLLPWSAFDVSKAIVGALTIVLSYIVGWRLTHKKVGGVIFAFIFTFASGARWGLQMIPQSVWFGAADNVNLWGQDLIPGPTLFTQLSQPWNIAGGPPTPLIFSYLNGILQPFILGVQAGPGALMRLILLLMILLFPQQRPGWKGTYVAVILFAVLALSAEAVFVLICVGIIGVAVLTRAWKRDRSWKNTFRYVILALIISVPFVLLQGGTITEMVMDLLRGSSAGTNAGIADFGLRWPPAIVSAHLGELHFTQPLELVVAIFEIGAALIAAPLVIWRAGHWLKQGRFVLASLVLASIIGFIIPMVLRYTFDRDVTRFSLYSLLIWILLAVPIMMQIWQGTRSEAVRAAIVSWVVLATFGGIIVFGSLISAIPYAVLPDEIEPVDALMARKYWDVLSPDAEILDSHPWRAVAITGRLTRSVDKSYIDLPERVDLLENVSPQRIAESGYGYIYVSDSWWESMDPGERSSFSDPCVRLIDGVEDGSDGLIYRRLYDVRECLARP